MAELKAIENSWDSKQSKKKRKPCEPVSHGTQRFISSTSLLPPLYTQPRPFPSTFGLGLAGLPRRYQSLLESSREARQSPLNRDPKTHSLLVRQICMRDTPYPVNYHRVTLLLYTQTIPRLQTLSVIPLPLASSDNTLCYVKCDVPKDCLASIPTPSPHSNR